MNKKALIYSRVSHQTQADKGTSLDNQDERLKDFCAYNKLDIIGEYTDAAVSGRTFNRPQLNKLFERVEQGGVDAVVVYSLSRFGRNAREILNYIEKLKSKKVDFHCVDLQLSTSNAMGMFVLQVMASIAELESGQLSERIRSVQSHLKDNKRVYCGQTPLGFRKKDGVLVEDYNEMRIVKKIFKLNEEGHSASSIAGILRRQAIRGKNGGSIQASTILKVLANEIYK